VASEKAIIIFGSIISVAVLSSNDSSSEDQHKLED
jgi:hypothetical protein